MCWGVACLPPYCLHIVLNDVIIVHFPLLDFSSCFYVFIFFGGFEVFPFLFLFFLKGYCFLPFFIHFFFSLCEFSLFLKIFIFIFFLQSALFPLG